MRPHAPNTATEWARASSALAWQRQSYNQLDLELEGQFLYAAIKWK